MGGCCRAHTHTSPPPGLKTKWKGGALGSPGSPSAQSTVNDELLRAFRVPPDSGRLWGAACKQPRGRPAQRGERGAQLGDEEQKEEKKALRVLNRRPSWKQSPRTREGPQAPHQPWHHPTMVHVGGERQGCAQHGHNDQNHQPTQPRGRGWRPNHSPTPPPEKKKALSSYMRGNSASLPSLSPPAPDPAPAAPAPIAASSSTSITSFSAGDSPLVAFLSTGAPSVGAGPSRPRFRRLCTKREGRVESGCSTSLPTAASLAH